MVLNALVKLLMHNSNQFASGGLLLMMIGGIVAAFRRVPVSLWNWTVEHSTIKLVITDSSNGFNWLKWWLEKQDFHAKSRHLDLFTPVVKDKREVKFGLAPGSRLFWYKRRPCRLTFLRNEEKGGSYYEKRTESFVLTTVGRNPVFLRDLMLDIKLVHDTSNTDPTLHFWRDGGWIAAPHYTPRPLDSVLIPRKQTLVLDIQHFKTREEWYVRQGIPYHRGYLLYGPPGTGKTSLVTALSNYFKCGLYVLRINDMSDDTLMTAVADVPAGAMILMEDIDCVAPKARTNISEKPRIPTPTSEPETEVKLRSVSLAGLLNVLDGLQSPYGVCFFLTTNHPEKLDAAMLRPGRVDVKLELGYATVEQKQQMYFRFFPDGPPPAEEMLTNHGCKTMADFQNLLLQEIQRQADAAEAPFIISGQAMHTLPLAVSSAIVSPIPT